MAFSLNVRIARICWHDLQEFEPLLPIKHVHPAIKPHALRTSCTETVQDQKCRTEAAVASLFGLSASAGWASADRRDFAKMAKHPRGPNRGSDLPCRHSSFQLDHIHSLTGFGLAKRCTAHLDGHTCPRTMNTAGRHSTEHHGFPCLARLEMGAH